MLFGVGAISVIMIIYSGILYVISAGSSEKIKKAKDTIKYSIVGLVISILAYAIVNFVIGSLEMKIIKTIIILSVMSFLGPFFIRILQMLQLLTKILNY